MPNPISHAEMIAAQRRIVADLERLPMADDRREDIPEARAINALNQLFDRLCGALQSEREAAPQDDLEGDVKHGNAEYFRAALAHAAAEARRAAIEECAQLCDLDAGDPGVLPETRAAAWQAKQLARRIRALASPARQEETR